MTGRFGPVEGIAALGVALLFYAGLSHAMSAGSMYHDYLGRYTEGALVWNGQAGQLYDVEAERQVQSHVGPAAKHFIPCTRPAFYALLMTPLAWFSVPAGYWLWVAVQSFCVAGAWLWARRRLGWGAASAVALFLPLGQGILGGQDNGFVLALVLGAWVQLGRGREGWAGALVGMTLFKSHLLLLLPAAMLVGRRWRMFAGYAALAAVEVAISVAVASPRSYLELLARKDLDRLSPSTFMMPNVYAILENLGTEHIVPRLVCALGIAILALWPRGSQDVAQNWFWAAAAGSILVTPHTYFYDISLLLPAIVLLAWNAERGAARGIAIMALLPLPWAAGGFSLSLAFLPALTTLLLFLAISGYLPRMGSQRESAPVPAA